MKTSNKLSAYILRGSTGALLFACVIVALCSAINLPEQPTKARLPVGDAVFEANGHESRSLSFAERVAYQRAIEDVYWRHRIWPKERPDPKPSLDAVLSQATIEKKVQDYLRNSEALEDHWQKPITGFDALHDNTVGARNAAYGWTALARNTTANDNVAVGNNALSRNTTGGNNIAVGSFAGSALTTGSNNIVIGNAGVSGDSSSIRVGVQGTQSATYVAGIWQAPLTGSAATVRVNSSGKLGTMPSSDCFKEAIRPMDKASEVIHSLQPVTFRYKKELDPEAVPQFGLVAEDVARVNPDLVIYDEEGRPFSVRYEEVNAMLLNEFLKEHRQGEQQDRKIEKLEATIAKQQKQIEALTTGLQKVSAQLELSKPELRTVLNNQ